MEAVHKPITDGSGGPVLYEGRELLNVDLEGCFDYMEEYARAVGKQIGPLIPSRSEAWRRCTL